MLIGAIKDISNSILMGLDQYKVVHNYEMVVNGNILRCLQTKIRKLWHSSSLCLLYPQLKFGVHNSIIL